MYLQISENFYFDMNQDSMKNMISMHIPKQDISTLSRSCVFSLTYPSPDVFLVIRVGCYKSNYNYIYDYSVFSMKSCVTDCQFDNPFTCIDNTHIDTI